MALNIYKISQNKNNDWGVYLKAVVCAENDEQARFIHPNSSEHGSWWKEKSGYDDWVKPEFVIVELIGITETLHAGDVICSENTGA